MNTTVFITPLLKSSRLKTIAHRARQLLLVFVLFLGLTQLTLPVMAADLGQLNVERAEDGIYLSANVRFDLPSVVEDAQIGRAHV